MFGMPDDSREIVINRRKAMLKRLSLIFMLIALSATLLAACGKKDDDDEEKDEAPQKVKWVPKGNEGSISGVAKFDGPVPTPQTIDMSGDPNCANAPGQKIVDDVTVADGKLANVYVYLKAGSLDRFTYDTPSDAGVLDQHGCHYTPRVMGLMVGQTLRVVNSDSTAHNVHPSPKQNTEWNKSQPPGAPPIEAKFNRAETLIPVKCNQHPWMKAHIGVLGHPFFAVTDKDGKYTINGVPPGKYTLIAWHEKFGEQQMKDFEVKASESKTQDFAYGAKAQAYQPTSLTVEPAFIVPNR
jgi:plastocyanin